MTREDIIKLAREASIEVDWSFDFHMRLERFAALVASAEREACAKVCDELAARDKLSNYYAVAAKAIRARGNK